MTLAGYQADMYGYDGAEAALRDDDGHWPAGNGALTWWT